MMRLVVVLLLMIPRLVFAQTEVSGNQSGVWSSSGSPYQVTGEIVVPAGQTLSIEHGVEVNFQGHFKFTVNGNLQAVGTENDPILFTTDNPSTGWGGIRIGSDDICRLEYCRIEFGKTAGDYPDMHGGGLALLGSDAVVTDCVFADNDATAADLGMGGAVYATGTGSLAEPLTRFIDCTFIRNHAYGEGGAIKFTGDYNTEITGCEFIANDCGYGGGAVSCYVVSGTRMTNCLFTENYTLFSKGGAINTLGSGNTIFLANCTLTGNSAVTGEGGAINLAYGTAYIDNTIVFDNPGLYGDDIYLDWGGSAEINYSNMPFPAGATGSNNIDEDPLFVQGSSGGHYLSQTAAGQSQESPSVDAGNPASDPVAGTTRTDDGADSGIVDQGYHYPLEMSLMVAAGPGPLYENPCEVRIFPASDGASHLVAFPAYGVSHYGVNVACGDVTGDGALEVLTGPGPGAMFGPHVRGFNGNGGSLAGLSFLAYGTNKYGVKISAGDLDGDGDDEIITGPGPGSVFGPHVRAFDYAGAAVTPLPGVSFFAYGTLRWGVNIAAGDFDGDGYDEIVTGAGPGAIFGPHVRGWNVDGGVASAIPWVSFLAYGTNRFGVRVSCGDLDGDGIAELVTAPGPSSAFGSHIRGWTVDGGSVTPLAGCSFFAWSPDLPRYGAQIFAGADLDRNGRDDMVVAPGPDPSIDSPIRVFSYGSGEITLQFSLDAFEPETYGGATVAAGPIGM